ncbi:MAG: hypothetical protein B7X78_10645 [Sphingomonadales bacterium 39-62-4]|nr:MAG: hypothetical protein B7X78_10645 [Sphingomonadales bacterium 39-62-4]
MKLFGACCLALVAGTACAEPEQRRSLRSCVAGVFGKDAEARIVSSEDEAYTDARIGESIQ